MAPLEASSGAAPDSRQRPPSTLPRAGASRGRLRYPPLVWNRRWGAVVLGRWPVGTVLGRCGATGGVQWRSRGFPAIARLDLAKSILGRLAGSSRPTPPDGHESILVPVDFGRIWPEVEGLLLPTGPNRYWCTSNLVDFGRK